MSNTATLSAPVLDALLDDAVPTASIVELLRVYLAAEIAGVVETPHGYESLVVDFVSNERLCEICAGPLQYFPGEDELYCAPCETRQGIHNEEIRAWIDARDAAQRHSCANSSGHSKYGCHHSVQFSDEHLCGYCSYAGSQDPAFRHSCADSNCAWWDTGERDNWKKGDLVLASTVEASKANLPDDLELANMEWFRESWIDEYEF